MKQKCKKIISRLLVICMVLALMPLPVAKAAGSGAIDILTQPAGELEADFTFDNPDYGTLSVVASGSAISYQWKYERHFSGGMISYTIPNGTNPSLNIPGDLEEILYPGEYEFYCVLTSGGTTVNTDYTRVTVNKLPYAGIQSDNMWVRSGQGTENNQYILPELPSGSFYQATASATGTLVSGTPVTYWNGWNEILEFDTVSAASGVTDTITLLIDGGSIYEDGTFTLAVEAVDKIPLTITGINGEDETYSGSPWRGYEGEPLAQGYAGGFEYHYIGMSYSGEAYGSTEAPANAGDYTLTVTPADGDYTGSASVGFSIQKKEVEVHSSDYYVSREDILPVLSEQDIYYLGFAGGDSRDNCLNVEAVPMFTGDTSQPGTSSITYLTQAVLNDREGSNYTLRHVEGILSVSQYSSRTDVLQVNLTQAVINLEAGTIQAEVPADTTFHTFVFTVGSGATWELYSDEFLTNKITDNTVSFQTGDNTVYLLVTSESQFSSREYTVTVKRKSAGSGGGDTGGDTGSGNNGDGNTGGGNNTGGTSSGTQAGDGNTSSYQITGSGEAWNKVTEELKSGTTGQISITMRETTVFPGAVLKELAGKKIAVTIELGNGISWVLKGSDITIPETEAGWKDIDLNAELDSGQIPEEVLSTLIFRTGTGTLPITRQLSLSHKGGFGFTARLILDLGKDMAGKTANLFYYNPDSKKLEFSYAATVKEAGTAEFGFLHASDYVIALDEGELAAAELKTATLAAEKSMLYTGGNTGKTTALKVSLPGSVNTLTKDDSLYPSITYASSNPKIALVNSTGTVTAISPGTVTITAAVTSGKVTVVLETKVIVKKAYITLVKEKSSYKLGESYTYKAVGYGVSTDKITFRTSKRSILVIGKKSGKATAKLKGTEYAVAECGSIRKVWKVAVK